MNQNNYSNNTSQNPIVPQSIFSIAQPSRDPPSQSTRNNPFQSISFQNQINPLQPSNLFQATAFSTNSPFNLLPSLTIADRLGEPFTLRGGFELRTSLLSIPGLLTQQTVTTRELPEGPTRTGVSSNLTQIDPIVSMLRSLFSLGTQLVSPQNSIHSATYQSSRTGRHPLEESKQEQGLSREQIAGLKTTVFQDEKQERGMPRSSRVKGRNGIFKFAKPDSKEIINSRQKYSTDSRKASLRGKKLTNSQGMQLESKKNPDLMEIIEEEDCDEVVEIDPRSSKKECQTNNKKVKSEQNHHINRPGPTSNATCAICLGDYNGGDKLRNLPCDHKFHIDCIDKWLVQKNACPVCKRKPIEETTEPIILQTIAPPITRSTRAHQIRPSRPFSTVRRGITNPTRGNTVQEFARLFSTTETVLSPRDSRNAQLALRTRPGNNTDVSITFVNRHRAPSGSNQRNSINWEFY